MRAVTHLEKVITGEISAVTHLEKVIAGEVSAVTYTEKVIAGEATPITHLQKVIAGIESPVTHLEHIWTGGSPTPSEHEYTGAVPVTITANGQPLLDYLISGNMTQTGTPTPTTPIQPQETGERTGNLFSGEFSQFDNVGGTGNIYTYFYIPEDFTLTLIAKDTHTIPDNTFLGITKDGGQSTGGFAWAISQRKNVIEGDIFTVKSSTSGYHYVSMYQKVATVLSWILDHYYVMLNTGSTALPYEPYGYKILISSANTTTPVYLGEVETTRRIKKLVLTGEENITAHRTDGVLGVRVPTSREVLADSIVVCSHAVNVSWSNYYSNRQYGTVTSNVGAGNSVVYMTAPDSEHNTLETLKSYLSAQYAAGTPVTVWYVLAEPTTGIVNEPIRKIGDYADTVSMEQAGVSIPTLNGQTVIDVDTTLKPSEVYIKYKG